MHRTHKSACVAKRLERSTSKSAEHYYESDGSSPVGDAGETISLFQNGNFSFSSWILSSVLMTQSVWLLLYRPNQKKCRQCKTQASWGHDLGVFTLLLSELMMILHAKWTIPILCSCYHFYCFQLDRLVAMYWILPTFAYFWNDHTPYGKIVLNALTKNSGNIKKTE